MFLLFLLHNCFQCLNHILNAFLLPMSLVSNYDLRRRVMMLSICGGQGPDEAVGRERCGDWDGVNCEDDGLSLLDGCVVPWNGRRCLVVWRIRRRTSTAKKHRDRRYHAERKGNYKIGILFPRNTKNNYRSVSPGTYYFRTCFCGVVIISSVYRDGRATHSPDAQTNDTYHRERKSSKVMV